MSLRSPHKDLFVFSIHTSGHKVDSVKHCQTLALVSLFSALWNTGMEPAQRLFKTASIESDRSERYRGIKKSLCWRQKSYVHKDKMCVLVTNGLFFHGQSMLQAAVYRSLFTGSDNGCVHVWSFIGSDPEPACQVIWPSSWSLYIQLVYFNGHAVAVCSKSTSLVMKTPW